MIEGRELKYMTVAILTSEEYRGEYGTKHLLHDIVIIDDGEESIVIHNKYGSSNQEKLKELHGLCVWCNENPTAYVVGAGCCECPSYPFECTCGVKDEPHALTCSRNPNGPRDYNECRCDSDETKKGYCYCGAKFTELIWK